MSVVPHDWGDQGVMVAESGEGGRIYNMGRISRAPKFIVPLVLPMYPYMLVAHSWCGCWSHRRDSNFHPAATLFVAVHINYTHGLPKIVPTLEFLSTQVDELSQWLSSVSCPLSVLSGQLTVMYHPRHSGLWVRISRKICWLFTANSWADALGQPIFGILCECFSEIPNKTVVWVFGWIIRQMVTCSKKSHPLPSSECFTYLTVEKFNAEVGWSCQEDPSQLTPVVQ